MASLDLNAVPAAPVESGNSTPGRGARSERSGNDKRRKMNLPRYHDANEHEVRFQEITVGVTCESDGEARMEVDSQDGTDSEAPEAQALLAPAPTSSESASPPGEQAEMTGPTAGGTWPSQGVQAPELARPCDERAEEVFVFTHDEVANGSTETTESVHLDHDGDGGASAEKRWSSARTTVMTTGASERSPIQAKTLHAAYPTLFVLLGCGLLALSWLVVSKRGDDVLVRPTHQGGRSQGNRASQQNASASVVQPVLPPWGVMALASGPLLSGRTSFWEQDLGHGTIALRSAHFGRPMYVTARPGENVTLEVHSGAVDESQAFRRYMDSNSGATTLLGFTGQTLWQSMAQLYEDTITEGSFAYAENTDGTVSIVVAPRNISEGSDSVPHIAAIEAPSRYEVFSSNFSLSGGKVFFKSEALGAYLKAALLDDILAVDSVDLREQETFTLIPGKAGTFALRAATGKYLSAQPWGAVRAGSSQVQEWELFRVIYHPDGSISLWTAHQRYVNAVQLNLKNSEKLNQEPMRAGCGDLAKLDHCPGPSAEGRLLDDDVDCACTAKSAGLFVEHMFPSGGYRAVASDSGDGSWRLHGPNCSSGGTVEDTLVAAADPTGWEVSGDGDAFITRDENLVRYHASIGNGLFAADMGLPHLYLACVFNGPDSAHANDNTVSHRAKVPNPLSLKPAHPYHGNQGAVLDMRRAVYTRRSHVPATTTRPSVFLEQRIYAHRAHPSLMILEYNASWETESAAEIHRLWIPTEGTLLADAVSPDFDVNVLRSSVVVGEHDVDIVLWYGTTKVNESGAAPVSVAVAVPADFGKDGLLLLERHHQQVIPASFRSSLDCDDPRGTALSDLQQALEDLRHDAANLPAAEAIGKEITQMIARDRATIKRRRIAGEVSTYSVREAHEKAWEALWQSGVEVRGRPDVERAARASAYYILSSLRDDKACGLSPGGLSTNGYNGHTFWDTETWMYPPLLVWHPPLAKSLLQYRANRLEGAKTKARSYSPAHRGIMFPWESAVVGVETCPGNWPEGRLEQHISADVALAMRQYFYMTDDTDWLRSNFELVRGVADFFASRAVPDYSNKSQYHIRDVIPPDEYAGHTDGHVSDSIYTNAVAREALMFADQAARLLQLDGDPSWDAIARGLVILFNESVQVHPEYEGYEWGRTIKQADVVLLPYPVGMRMSQRQRLRDLEYYASVTDPAGPAMTWSMHAIGYLEVGDHARAAGYFNRSFMNSKWPFGVWTETPSGGIPNFITGAGGFLQTLTFGYPGLRIHADYIELTPRLPEGSSAVSLRGLHYRGSSISVLYDQSSITLRRVAGLSFLAQRVMVPESARGVVQESMLFPAGSVIRIFPQKPSSENSTQVRA